MKNVVKKSSFGFLLFTVLAVLFSLIPLQANAAINPQINFQGKITNPDGTNIANGSYTIRYRLYTDPTLDAVAACGATTCRWEETKSVTVTSGIFQTALGDTTSLPGSIDFNSANIYLGIKVGADPEMAPRVRFTASPYAFNSDRLNGLSSSAFAQLTVNNTFTGTTTLQGSAATQLRVLNGTSQSLLTVDASANRVLIGQLGTTGVNGVLGFNSATAGNFTASLGVSTALASSYLLNLPTSLGTDGQCVSQSGLSGSTATLAFTGCANLALSNLSATTAINSNLTFDNTANRSLSITTAPPGVAGRQLSILASNAGTSATALTGGNLLLSAGSGSSGTTSNGAGGALTVSAGSAGTGTGTNAAGGGVTIQGGNASTTGAGNANGGTLTLDSGVKANAGTSTIDIGATNATTINYGSSTATVAHVFKSANTATAFQVQNASSINMFSVNTSALEVQIGSATTDATAVTLVLDSYSVAADPTGRNGAMYYNTNLSKFRCFEASAWKDCITAEYVLGTRSFVDSTADAVVDANTTNYWDIGAENNNSTPNITLSATSKSIWGIATVETLATSTQDIEVTARVERGIGAPPTCGSGTSVGGSPGTFASNTNARKTSTTQFVDNPNTLQKIFYTVCSDTDTTGTAANITRIRITLFELDNSNL